MLENDIQLSGNDQGTNLKAITLGFFNSMQTDVPDDTLNTILEQGNAWDQELEKRKQNEYVDPSFYQMQKEKEMLDVLVQNPEAPISNSARELSRRDPKYSYQRTKELVHDIAHESSTEQAVVDSYRVMQRRKAKPQMLSPEEAHALSKDRGVELKFDKPVSLGEAEYSIEKQLRTRELERELAYYNETNDYNVLQKLMLAKSAIQGSIGFLEFAGMTALSYYGGMAAAGSLARAASVINKTSKLSTGIKMAQKAIIAERAAMRYANAIDDVGVASRTLASNLHSRYLATAKEQGFAGKLGYDMYRMGKGIQGAHASTITTSIPFAIDGALTTLPSELIKQQGDILTHTGEYSTKKVIANTMLGATFGAGMPVAGTLIRKAPSALDKLSDLTSGMISKKVSAESNQNILKGYDAVAKEVEEAGTNVSKLFKESFDVVSKQNELHPEVVKNAIALSGDNLSEDEFQTMLYMVMDAIRNGKPISSIEQLPFRNKYYSNVLGMFDTIQELSRGDKTHLDFFKYLGEGQIPTITNRPFKSTGDEVLDTLTGLKEGKLGVGIKLGNEGGALGRLYAHGLTQDEAKKFLFNVYMTRMSENAERGVQAGLEAEEYIAKLSRIKKQVDEIVNTYETIQQANDAARKAKKPTPFRYSEKEQDIYMLSNGNDGSIEEALEDLAELLLPDSKVADIAEARRVLGIEDMNIAQKGRMEISADDYDRHQAVLQELQAWQGAVKGHLGSKQSSKTQKGVTYFNLNALVKGSAEQTGMLKQFSNQLDEMIQDNLDLLNTDRVFQQTIGNPEDILKRIEMGEDIPELGFSYNKQGMTATAMRDLIQDEEATLARLNAAKVDVEARQSSKAVTSLSEILETESRQFEAQERAVKGYVTRIQENIVAAEKILNGDFGVFRNKLIDKLQKNEYFQNILKQGELTEGAFKQALKEQGLTFRTLLKETLQESMLNEMNLTSSFIRELDDMLENVTDSFIDKLRKDPKGGLRAFAEQHSFNKDASSTQEMVDTVNKVSDQKKLFDEMLQPLMQDLALATADIQTQALHVQSRVIDLWERCLDTPGKMTEVILGDITTTWLPKKGASVSMERLSDFNTEYRTFLRQLDATDNGLEPLSKWAFEPENMPEIKEAILDRWAMLSGRMSEEQQMRFEPNTNAGRVAQAYLDNLSGIQANLYDIGSGKQDLVSFFHPTKLRNAHSYIKHNAINGRIYNCITDTLTQNKKEYAGIQEALSKFLPMSKNKEDMGRANLALHWFEQLDLDTHFNKKGIAKVSLNEVRDAILDGYIPGQGSAIDRLVIKHGIKEVEKAIGIISDGFMGVPGKDLGLIHRLTLDTGSTVVDRMRQGAKYLEDLKPKLHYKSLDAQKLDMQYLGFDDMKSWYESNVGTAKKAYAILAKCGSEPFEFYNAMKEMARTYAAHHAHKKYSAKEVEAMKNTLGRDSFDRAMDYSLNSLCGTFSNPSNAGLRWLQIVSRIISAPMLTKAGIKSATDYSYQFQSLVTMGLASSTDVGARARIWGKFVNVMQSKKLAQALYMSQTLKSNTMYEMLYNTPALGRELGADALKGSVGNLNEYAPALLKAEHISKGWSDFILNKLAWIGPLTEYNRTNAALSMMQAVGDFADTPFASMNGRLQQTLNRYGISDYEWDNIFSKEAVVNLNDHLLQHNGDTLGDLSDMKMFLPERLLELEDTKVIKFLQDQGRDTSPAAVRLYKQNLIDRASILINASADEMTSIPSARIQGMLSFGHNPNDWRGALANMALQFQSFGAAVNFYHWGRRYATHISPDDPLFNNMLLCASGFGSTATDMAGFVTELAITQYFINEGIAGLVGNRRELHDDVGEFQWDILGEKVAKAYIDQAGLASPVLDSMLTSIQRGSGTGGALALSIFPAASNVQRKVSRVIDAATRKSTEGQRGKAVAGALSQDAAEIVPVATLPYTQAVWNYFIGDTLTEWQMGTRYPQYIMQRRRKGYAPSWVSNLSDNIQDMFTDF